MTSIATDLAQSGQSALLGIAEAIAASNAGASGESGDVTGAEALASVDAAQFGQSGALILAAAIVASNAAGSTQSAQILVDNAIEGSAAGQSGQSGAVIIVHALSTTDNFANSDDLATARIAIGLFGTNASTAASPTPGIIIATVLASATPATSSEVALLFRGHPLPVVAKARVTAESNSTSVTAKSSGEGLTAKITSDGVVSG